MRDLIKYLDNKIGCHFVEQYIQIDIENVVCYVDDTILIAKSDGDLRIQFQFYKIEILKSTYQYINLNV